MTYLISACLLGAPCRYDGESRPMSEAIQKLFEGNVLIPICPEVMGGLPTPRTPAERVCERVLCRDGRDVSDAYRRGAEEVLRLVRLYRAEGVILRDRSPSCGTDGIYDGTFLGRLTAGMGVTAELLAKAGVPILNERGERVGGE